MICYNKYILLPRICGPPTTPPPPPRPPPPQKKARARRKERRERSDDVIPVKDKKKIFRSILPSTPSPRFKVNIFHN